MTQKKAVCSFSVFCWFWVVAGAPFLMSRSSPSFSCQWTGRSWRRCEHQPSIGILLKIICSVFRFWWSFSNNCRKQWKTNLQTSLTMISIVFDSFFVMVFRWWFTLKNPSEQHENNWKHQIHQSTIHNTIQQSVNRFEAVFEASAKEQLPDDPESAGAALPAATAKAKARPKSVRRPSWAVIFFGEIMGKSWKKSGNFMGKYGNIWKIMETGGNMAVTSGNIGHFDGVVTVVTVVTVVWVMFGKCSRPHHCSPSPNRGWTMERLWQLWISQKICFLVSSSRSQTWRNSGRWMENDGDGRGGWYPLIAKSPVMSEKGESPGRFLWVSADFGHNPSYTNAQNARARQVVKDTVMTKELKVSGDNAVRQLKADEACTAVHGADFHCRASIVHSKTERTHDIYIYNITHKCMNIYHTNYIESVCVCVLECVCVSLSLYYIYMDCIHLHMEL